jgi:hypothetical protein
MDGWATALVVGGFTAYMAYVTAKKDVSVGLATTIWGLCILGGIVLSGGVLLKKPEDAFLDGIRNVVANYGFPGFVGVAVGAVIGYLAGEREAKGVSPRS